MKSIFKATILALMLCATIMSGCIGTDDTPDGTNVVDEPTSVTNMLGNPNEKPIDEPAKSDESDSIISDIIDKVSGSDSNDLPFTVSLPMGDLTHLFIFEENGAGEQCASWVGEVWCLPLEWERTSDDRYVFTMDQAGIVSVTIRDNGVAILESDETGDIKEGNWKAGVNK